jgi:phosphoribosyl-dephospho-CoA transferase
MVNISVTGILREYKTFSRDFWLQYKALEAVMPETEWNNVKMILLRTKRVGPEILAKVDIEAYEMKKAEIDADWL